MNLLYKQLCLSLLAFIIFGTAWQNSFASERELIVASWNVENLFDTINNPDTEGDDAYTPRGWVHWTDKRYKGKLEHLAEVIASIKPDILCLSEVENRKVLEDLNTTLKEKFNFELPYITHREGDDFRGIDVAMLSKYKPVNRVWFSAISGQRDVLACDYKIDGKDLTVLVNHWKSKLGNKKRSDYIRNQQAISVRKYIDKELKSNPATAIVVTGDFNSNISESFLTETAGFLTDRKELVKKKNRDKLYNLAADLGEQERKTYYYTRGKQWNSLDSISVTRGMLGINPKSAWQVKPNSYKVYKPKKVCFKELGSPLPYRRVRSKKVGDKFISGYSDHFAVYVVLVSGK